ncbi:T4SS efffector SepA family protein [Neoaquamicrobium sediminum]|uniref:T4SS efffector SepA family protein n=1 Tax=Neoaquamicrobium sediminum TaxID=1849104 RepID=UPI001566643B|nr:hypothetical protein [Mesorhizobium sediminum]NRC57164.1 hypothetical protein [Mesorhizobium sediminum]
MMPVVRISDATFSDLKLMASWFGTKTPAETLDRVIRETMDQLGLERDDEPAEAVVTSGGAMHFDVAPGLAFTKPLSATINGKAVPSPRWSSVLLTTIAQLKAKGLDGEKLVRELGIPAKAVQFEDEGFKYHPHLGISVQGQSASDAWKEVERLAKKWHIPVTVEFWWRQNPKAQYPGRTGILKAGSQP